MKHLMVIQADGRGRNVEMFDPAEHDFRWSSNYLVFEPVKLRWTNDKSYANYQANSGEDWE